MTIDADGKRVTYDMEADTVETDGLTPKEAIAVDQVFMCYRKRFYTEKNVADEIKRILEGR